MTVASSLHLSAITNGNPVDVTKVNGELAWIESRAVDLNGDTLDGPINYAADTGTANTYVVTLSPAWSSLATGNLVAFTVLNTNTGASTLNVNGLGAKSILKWGSHLVVAGDLTAGSMVIARYDGTAFQLVTVPRIVPFAQIYAAQAHIWGFTDCRNDTENLVYGWNRRPYSGGPLPGLNGSTWVAQAHALGVYRLATDSVSTAEASATLWCNAASFPTAVLASPGVRAVQIVAGRVNTGVTSMTQKVWMFGSVNTDMGSTVTGGSFFRIQAAGSPATICCVSRQDVATETVTDTGIADSNAMRNFEVIVVAQMPASYTTTYFYLDGVLRATHVVQNLNVVGHYSLCALQTLEAASKAVDVDWLLAVRTPKAYRAP